MIIVPQHQGETPTLWFNATTATARGTEKRDEIRRKERRAGNEVEAERTKPVDGTLWVLKDKQTLRNSIST